MGVAKNKQVVRDFYEAGARGDMDTCFALMADHVTCCLLYTSDAADDQWRV